VNWRTRRPSRFTQPVELEPFRDPIDLAALRRMREARGLERVDLDPDPFAELRSWFDDAVSSGLHQPEAMVVASASTSAGVSEASEASASSMPSARMVLMRGIDDRGLTFFTNYESRKGRELDANPNAAALFPWHAISRQIRVQGRVERLDAAESDAYFASRARGSQLSAWASPQSEVVESREVLDARRVEEASKWGDRDIERPPFWGGYRLVADELEFWQGRSNRFHDRFRYRRAGAGTDADRWIIERLAP